MVSGDSLLWNPELRFDCHQVRSGFEQANGKMKQEQWPMGDMSGYVPEPSRPCNCKSKMGFMTEQGHCPDHIVLTYRNEQSEFGKDPGWEYVFDSEKHGDRDVSTLEFRLKAANDPNPCGHRELGIFHYSYLGKHRHHQVRPNPSNEHGDWDLDAPFDLIYEFDFRVLDRTSSKCKNSNPFMRRNIVKSILMYDYVDHSAGPKLVRRPNGVSIWLDLEEGIAGAAQRRKFFRDKTKEKNDGTEVPDVLLEDDQVVWWNGGRAHGDWGNATNMLTLWLGESDAIGPSELEGYRSVRINLSQLMRDYSVAFPPAFGQSTNQAVFRNIANVGAVTGADLTYRIANVDLKLQAR